MFVWEGIEDANKDPDPVWFERTILCDGSACTPSSNEWRPLRKADCNLLNEVVMKQKVLLHCQESSNSAQVNYSENIQGSSVLQNAHNFTDASLDHFVNIESGRSKVDLDAGRIYSNFCRGNERELISATWFLKEKKNNSKDDINLLPIPSSSDDATKIECLYQKAVSSISSTDHNIDVILNDEVELSDNSSSKAIIVKAGNTLSIKIVSNSNRPMSSADLQRGFGKYVVAGEENELALGPLRHVIFVVHGIGEAMFSRHDVPLPSTIESIDAARLSMYERQINEWKIQSGNNPQSSPPSRTELIPIEWYSQIHDNSSLLMKTLQRTTLKTIPALRSIANDVIFDVLMYMTPTFCECVLECVTEQIIEYYEVLKQVHPDFFSSGGKISLAGHSLGSVIIWDLLSVLKGSFEWSKNGSMRDSCERIYVKNDGDKSQSQIVERVHASLNENNYHMCEANDSEWNDSNVFYGRWGPLLTKRLSKTIPFTPACTLFFGSPIGLFLTLRSAHCDFDEMCPQNTMYFVDSTSNPSDRTESVTSSTKTLYTHVQCKVCSFNLPTGKLYNIFHPSDPIAYRLEPLMMAKDTDENDIPPPLYLQPPGQDLQIHIKLKQMSEIVMKLISLKFNEWGSLLETATNIMGNGSDDSKVSCQQKNEIYFPLGGQNRRVDFSLQPGVLENEYIGAVKAHGCYFANSEIQSLLVSLI